MLFLGLSETFISIGIWIVSGIYNVAAIAFKIFIILANADVIDSNDYRLLIENFYVIIGIIMLFILAFALLKGMVNPDDQKNGAETAKKTVINLVTSALILVLLPSIFAFAFDFQNSVLSQNTIGMLFGMGRGNQNNSIENTVDLVNQESNTIVNGVYTAFFNVNSDNCVKILGDSYTPSLSGLESCQGETRSGDKSYGNQKRSLFDVIEYVNKNGSFNSYNAFSENVDEEEIDFNFLLSLIAGLILIYVGVSFCFDMAVRLVKLVFYQLIAPIPLFMRVIPNSKFSDIFSRWTKVTLTCYLEVYIRILVFYFCVYLCKKMTESVFFSSTIYAYGGFVALLAKAFVIMGIVIFMRQAPKIFKEVTGLDSGNMKLGIRDKLKEGGFFAATNAAGSLIASHGNPLGMVRGLKYGWKNGDMRGIGNEVLRHQQYSDARKAGAKKRQILSDSFLKSTFGIPTAADRNLRNIDERKEKVVNSTGNDISYVDSRTGKTVTVRNGESFAIDKQAIADLESKKAENVQQMSQFNENIRNLDKLIKYGEMQIGFKSEVKGGEAEKKIDEAGSKVLHTLDLGNGKTFTGNFAQIQDFINKDLTPEERQKFNLNDIRDQMIKKYVNDELASVNDTRIKQLFRKGFDSLIDNGGYTFYEYQKNADGTLIYGDDKRPLEREGKIEVELDTNTGKYIVSKITKDKDGRVLSTEVLSDTKSYYEILEDIDKLAKESNGVLNSRKQHIEDVDINSLKTENENIDGAIKAANESKEAEKKSLAQRQKEASKTYVGDRGKNS